MRKVVLPVSIAVMMSLVLGGCASGPSQSIRVVMTDFAFTPPTYTIPAGASISVELVNDGAATHSFMIMKAGYQVQGHFTDSDKSHVYWQESEVAPGGSVSATFVAPSEPGEYQIVCGIPAHFEAGMSGKLVVVKVP